MGTDATITLGAIALLISLFITVYNFYDARKKRAKEEGREEGVVSEKLNTILSELKKLGGQFEAMEKRIDELASKSDNHETRIVVLEKKRKTNIPN